MTEPDAQPALGIALSAASFGAEETAQHALSALLSARQH